MVKIMKVAQDATGEPQPVGQTVKKQIVLQDLEGYSKDDRRIGAVVADMFGNLARCAFYEGDLVAVSLQFATHEYQGNVYQDITVREIHKIN